MKNLVLSSLLFAALVSQTTGCIITSGEEATLTAEWSFHTVNPQGMLSPENNCPVGFTEVELHTQELDTLDRPIGRPVIDVFDCDAHIGDAPLDPTVYEAFLSVTSPEGDTIYADTLATIVDLTDSDKTFKAEVVDNGGYFKVAWDLRDVQTGSAITCADASRLDGIEINATLAGSSAATNDQFDCENGFDFSAAVMEGNYVVSVNAFEDATPNDKLLGEVTTLNNKTMRDRNQVTDLGTVMIRVPRQ
jgi:hypothetical protein